MNRYVTVKLQSKTNLDGYSNREYTYIDGVGVKPDDLVVAPTARGDCVGKVIRTDVSENEISGEIMLLLKTIEKLHVGEEAVVNG